MQYVWNPEFDIFCLNDRVDFVAIDHEISFEGGEVTKAMGKLINVLIRQEKGFTFTDALQALAIFDEQDVHQIWQMLLRESLLKDQKSIVIQSQLCWSQRGESGLFEHFPTPLSHKPHNQIGFRFGGLYLLAKSDQELPTSHFAKQVLEWTFNGKWLDRARPLVWQTNETANAGKEFLAFQIKQWLQLTLDALLRTSETDCLYEIDLRSFEIKCERLSSDVPAIGVLAPIVRQDGITDADRKVGFMPSFSIVQSRYRQPAIWEGGKQYLACGAHPNPWIAHLISAAEAVERSAAATCKIDDLSFGRITDDLRRVDPRSLIELGDDQQSDGHLSSFNLAKLYYWRDAIELMSGREVQVIADLCYFSFHPPGYDHQFAWGNSSGMAAGRTLGEAQISALFELIERDAFMITWISKQSAPLILDSLIPLSIKESQRQLQLIGYTTRLVDITIRGVPTVLGVAHRNEWPALILGAAARNTLIEAIHAAWKEVEVGLYSRLLDPIMKESNKPVLQAGDVITSDDHAKFYNHPNHLQFASFLWGSDKNSDRSLEARFFKDLTEENIVSLCRHLGLDRMYLVNYGSVYGFQVVRLLSPHLVPLTFGYNQLPRQQVVKSNVLDMHTGVLPETFPVHPFD